MTHPSTVGLDKTSQVMTCRLNLIRIFGEFIRKKAAVGKVSAFENNINYIILTKNEIQIRYQKINLTIKHLENSIIKKWYQLNEIKPSSYYGI